jgi:hypothetical protein
MRNRLNAAGSNSLAAYSNARDEEEKKEKKNKGGLLSGVGYVGGQLLSGIFGVGEGVYDFVVGGIADAFGAEEFSERLIKDDVTGDWQRGLNEWYNPSKGMQFVGDVASGLGQTATYVGLNLIPGAGPVLSTGAMVAGAGGRGVTAAYQKTGKLGNQEWLYGAGSGLVEMGLEKLTGGVGKITKSITKSAGKEVTQTVAKSAVRSGLLKNAFKTGAGEFVEEAASEFIDPYLQRLTIDKNAENASLGEILRAGAVGFVSGAIGSAGGSGIGNAGSVRLGNKIINEENKTFKVGNRVASTGNVDSVLGNAENLLSTIDSKEASDFVAGNLVNLKASYDAYNKLSNKEGIRGKMLLGEIAKNIAYTEVSQGVDASKIGILDNAEDIAQYLTNKKGEAVTVEDIKNNKDNILTDLAIADFSAKMIVSPEYASEMVSQGKMGVLKMQSQYEAWKNSLTQEQLAKASADLGVDLSTASYKDFNKAMGVLSQRKAMAQEEANALTEQKKQGATPLPQSVSLTEGETQVYRTQNGDFVGVKRTASGYTVAVESADGSTKQMTAKPVTEAQVNELIGKINENTAATETETQRKSLSAQETESATETTKSVAEESKVKQIQAKAKTKALTEKARALVKDFDSLPGNTKARIREMIDTAQAFNVSEENLKFISYFMVRRGVAVSFAEMDGNGVYDTENGNRFIQLNGKNSAKAIRSAAIHEFAHDLRDNSEDYKILSDLALKTLTEEDKKGIKDLYEAYYEEKGKELTEDILNDELTAYALEKSLNNEDFLKKHLNENTEGFYQKAKRLASRIASWFKGKNTKGYQTYKALADLYDAVLEAPRTTIIDKIKERASLSSMSVTFFGKENANIEDFENRRYKQREEYKTLVEEYAKNMEQSRGESFNREEAIKEIESSIDGIVDVAVAMKKAGYDILDNGKKRTAKDSKGRSLFSSLEPNSDYITSNDISTICDKRKNFSEIHDDIVKREEELKVPEGKRFFDNVDNYFVLHKYLADRGLTTPCRQCYVESMRKNLAPMANAFLSMVKETDAENTDNKQLWQKAKASDEIVVIGRDGKRYTKKATNTEIRENVLKALEEHQEYGLTINDLTVEMLSTEDGLSQLRIQAPIIYEYFNSFYGQAKPKMPREATPFRFGELTAMLTDEKGNIKQGLVERIKSTGGFRLQSYSDFQIENFADVLQVIFEAGTLGLNGHAYTKVPAFLEATEGTNLKRNISIFMYQDGKSWKLDKNDSFPYDLDKIYDIVKKDKSGNTGVIAVVQNEDMAAWVMANENIAYFIPFHKSGIKMAVVRDTVVKEGGKEIKGYANIKDHTKQQSEVWAKTEDGHKALTKVKKGIDIYKFWDFSNKEGLSQKKLIEKNVKAYIDACNENGYIPKFREYVMNNGKILNSVLAYSKELGFVSQDATIDDISFEYSGYRIPYGYYKCLGDFGMFKPNGDASPIKPLSLKNYNFAKAVKFFTDANSVRRNEILQQIANGEERERIRNSNMSTAEIYEYVQNLRKSVVEDVIKDTHKIADTSRQSLTPTNTIVRNKEYMDAVTRGDMETAQRMVDEAAKEAGYDSPKLYHGTKMFGFTEVKTSGVEKGVTWSPFFAANKEDISASYVPYGKVRDISSSMDDDAIEEAREIAIETRKENISNLVYDFRRLIDRHFSPWVFGQTGNSYLESLVENANPVAGDGDGVYDVLSEIVYDSFYDYQDEFGEYDDVDDWAENSPEGKKIFSKIVEIEGEKSALYSIESGEELGGIYQLYANLDNMYVVDGKGADWNELRPEGLPKIERYGVKDAPYKTRDVAKWASDNGFDGVIFKNIRDNGAYGRTPSGDVYAFFRPESQIKSADAVTYDDNGNVIPLSERFKSDNKDIRFSLTYAPTGKTNIVMDNTLSRAERREAQKAAKKYTHRFQSLRVAFVNQQAAIEDAFKDMGVSLEEYEAITQTARSASSKAQRAIGGDIVDPSEMHTSGDATTLAKGIQKVMAPVKKAKLEEEFFDYLFNRHNIDRLKVDKPVNGNTAEESQAVIERLEKQHPEMKKWGEEWDKMVGALLTLRVKEGIITQEQADYLRETYPHYVPTYREGGAKQGMTGGFKGKNDVMISKTLKKATGSTEALLRPDEVIARQIMETYRAIGGNYVANQLYESYLASGKKHPDIEIVSKEKVTKEDAENTDVIGNLEEGSQAAVNKTNGTVTFYRDGERITMRVSSNILAGFDGFYKTSSVYEQNIVARTLAKGMQLFKSAVTNWNPFFLIRNAVRDIQDAAIYTKNGKNFAFQIPNAWTGIATNSKEWQLYLSAGGMNSNVFGSEGFTGMVSERGFETIDVSSKQGLKQAWSFMKKQGMRLEAINMVVEQIPRFAEFLASRKAGKTVDQALLDSADVTVNFGRSGSVTRIANRYFIPFINASVQGASKIFRTAAGRKSAAAWCSLAIRCAVLGIVPAILNNAMYDDDEDYQNLRTDVKENYFLFKIGEGKFIKLPKGRINAIISGAVVRTDLARKGEEDAWEGYGESVLNTLTPVESASRTIFSPFTDVKTNTTWYGTAIEGREFENKAIKDRYDETTSSIAIWLGKSKIMQDLGYSPKKIHYLIDQYTGVIGDVLLPATNKVAEKGLFDANLTVDAVTSNKLSSKFYKIYDETTYKKSAGDENAALELRYLNKVKEAVSDLYKEKDKVNASNKTEKEKLAENRIIQTLINQTYQNALDEKGILSNAFAATKGIGSEYSVVEVTKKNYKKLEEKQDNIGAYVITRNGLTTGKLYESQEKATKGLTDMIADYRYTEGVHLMHGAERALKYYNTATYEKAQKLNGAGVSYDDYYFAYMTAKQYAGDSEDKREFILETIAGLDLSREQTLLMIYAFGYSVKDGEFYGMTSKAAKTRMARYIKSLKISTEEKISLAKACGLTVKNGKIVTK